MFITTFVPLVKNDLYISFSNCQVLPVKVDAGYISLDNTSIDFSTEKNL